LQTVKDRNSYNGRLVRNLHAESMIVCKRSLGWINYDNYVHITQPKRKIIYLIATCRSPTANFIRQVVT